MNGRNYLDFTWEQRTDSEPLSLNDMMFSTSHENRLVSSVLSAVKTSMETLRMVRQLSV